MTDKKFEVIDPGNYPNFIYKIRIYIHNWTYYQYTQMCAWCREQNLSIKDGVITIFEDEDFVMFKLMWT